jgi:hypothetical protein
MHNDTVHRSISILTQCKQWPRPALDIDEIFLQIINYLIQIVKMNIAHVDKISAGELFTFGKQIKMFHTTFT